MGKWIFGSGVQLRSSKLAAAFLIGLCCLGVLAHAESKNTRLYDLRPESDTQGLVFETVSNEIITIELLNESGELTREVSESTTTKRRKAIRPPAGYEAAFIEELTSILSKRKITRGTETLSETTTRENDLLNQKIQYARSKKGWDVLLLGGEKEEATVENKVLAKLAQEQLLTDNVYYPVYPVTIGDEWTIGAEAIVAVVGSLPIEIKAVQVQGHLREVEEVKEDRIASIAVEGTGLGTFATGQEGVDWAAMVTLKGEIQLSLRYGYEVASLIEASIAVAPEESKEVTLKAHSRSESHAKILESSTVSY